MERLRQPEIVVVDEPEPGWLTIPREGLKRTDFIKAWQKRMKGGPLPEAGALKVERPGWSGDVARATWLRAEPDFTATAEDLMWKNLPVVDAQEWAAVTRAWARYVEPLARYTAGWTDSLNAWHPKGVPGPVGDAIRTARRVSPGKVRNDMNGERIAAIRRDPIASVIADKQSLEAFFADPEARRERDEVTAIVSYLHALSAFVANPGKRRDKLNRDQLVTVVDYTDDLYDDPQLPTPFVPTPDFIAECRRLAKARTDEVVQQMKVPPRLYERFHEAYIRMVKTQTERLLRGDDINVSERLMWARMKAVKADEARQAERPAAPDAPASGDSSPQVRGPAIDLVRKHWEATTDGHHDWPSWEHEVAIDIIEAVDDTHFAGPQAIRDYVEQRWLDEQPSNSTSVNEVAAGFVVIGVLALALAPQDNPESDNP